MGATPLKLLIITAQANTHLHVNATLHLSGTIHVQIPTYIHTLHTLHTYIKTHGSVSCGPRKRGTRKRSEYINRNNKVAIFTHS